MVVARAVGSGGATPDVARQGVLPETAFEGHLPEAATSSEGSPVGAAIAPETIQGVGNAAREEVTEVEEPRAPMEVLQTMDEAVAAAVTARVPRRRATTVAPAVLLEGAPSARTVPAPHLVLVQPVVPGPVPETSGAHVLAAEGARVVPSTEVPQPARRAGLVHLALHAVVPVLVPSFVELVLVRLEPEGPAGTNGVGAQAVSQEVGLEAVPGVMANLARVAPCFALVERLSGRQADAAASGRKARRLQED